MKSLKDILDNDLQYKQRPYNVWCKFRIGVTTYHYHGRIENLSIFENCFVGNFELEIFL